MSTPAGPTAAFWDERFARGELNWDRGAASPQIEVWLREGRLRAGQHVVVPGCGSGHEVLALAQAGLRVTALDLTQAALALTQARLDEAGAQAELVQTDVLRWSPPTPVDVVYDQTLWCALHPDHWLAWSRQLAAWLRPGGDLLLLAMQALRANAAQGFIEGPPYHMDVHMLRALLMVREWDWPKPEYVRVPHPRGMFELALALRRRDPA